VCVRVCVCVCLRVYMCVCACVCTWYSPTLRSTPTGSPSHDFLRTRSQDLACRVPALILRVRATQVLAKKATVRITSFLTKSFARLRSPGGPLGLPKKSIPTRRPSYFLGAPRWALAWLGTAPPNCTRRWRSLCTACLSRTHHSITQPSGYLA